MKTLKYYRVDANLTVKEAAEHMNVSARVLYAWEDGSRAISTYNLVRLLSLYEVDLPVSAIPALFPVTLNEETATLN